jgi:tetratricopeptide (TPR) repeat protein
MNQFFGDLERLLRHFDSRLAAQPQYADICNLRGLARAHAGDSDGARSDLESALRINRDYDVARYNLAWLITRTATDGELVPEALEARVQPPARAHLEIVRLASEEGPEAARRALSRYADDTEWWDLDRLWITTRARQRSCRAAERSCPPVRSSSSRPTASWSTCCAPTPSRTGPPSST